MAYKPHKARKRRMRRKKLRGRMPPNKAHYTSRQRYGKFAGLYKVIPKRFHHYKKLDD